MKELTRYNEAGPVWSVDPRERVVLQINFLGPVESPASARFWTLKDGAVVGAFTGNEVAEPVTPDLVIWKSGREERGFSEWVGSIRGQRVTIGLSRKGSNLFFQWEVRLGEAKVGVGGSHFDDEGRQKDACPNGYLPLLAELATQERGDAPGLQAPAAAERISQLLRNWEH